MLKFSAFKQTAFNSMGFNKKKKGNTEPVKTKKVILKAVSKRQVNRFLKEPLSHKSAVVYFTERDHRPFLLGPNGGGISVGGKFQLTKKWKLKKDKLQRIFIITTEADIPPEDNLPDEED